MIDVWVCYDIKREQFLSNEDYQNNGIGRTYIDMITDDAQPEWHANLDYWHYIGWYTHYPFDLDHSMIVKAFLDENGIVRDPDFTTAYRYVDLDIKFKGMWCNPFNGYKYEKGKS